MRTGQEIRDIFNLHYDNIMSAASPGLNDYEISLYLTQAHKEIIYNYYSGNNKGDSFDSSEKTRTYLSHYVKSETIQNLTAASNPPTKDLIYKECILDDSVWWIIRDSVTLSTGRNILVKPIVFDEFWVLVEDPFKKPNGLRAWRLDMSAEGKRSITLISSRDFTAYNLSYIVRPGALIISDLDNIIPGLTIEGESQYTLPDSLLSNDLLLDTVINRAVELATRDYKRNDLESQIQVNNRVE
nr:MAG: hypothetical protein [Bacteriophage sp.]